MLIDQSGSIHDNALNTSLQYVESTITELSNSGMLQTTYVGLRMFDVQSYSVIESSRNPQDFAGLGDRVLPNRPHNAGTAVNRALVETADAVVHNSSHPMHSLAAKVLFLVTGP